MPTPPASTSAIGLERDERHNYRWNGGPWNPGVTTIVGMLDKSDVLTNWAKRETAASAIRNHDLLGELIATGGAQSAQDWLSRIPDYIKDAAADMGSKVHYYAEKLGLGQELPEIHPNELARTQSFIDWEKANKPEFVLVEFMVFSEKYQYGGTGDVFLRLKVCPAKNCGKNNCLWLIDYKTGKGIYETAGLQLMALQRADFIGHRGSPDKIEIPTADHFGILHITDAGSRLVQYEIGESEWETFRACRRLKQWVQKEMRTIKVEL